MMVEEEDGVYVWRCEVVFLPACQRVCVHVFKTYI